MSYITLAYNLCIWEKNVFLQWQSQFNTIKERMNVSSLIKQHFTSDGNDVTIDVFDGKNIYTVYKRVVGVLTKNMTIETTVLQGMSYCFYENLTMF